MDSSPESTPTKKRCIFTSREKMPPVQCVREFQQLLQFPGVMKQVLKSDTSVAEPATSSPVPLPDTARLSSSTKNRVPYNLQKLRILSPRGRDLGEFRVKLRPADSSKGNAITISKSNFKPNGKPLTLPLSPVSSVKALPRVPRQSASKASKWDSMPWSESDLWIDNTGASHRQRFTTPNKKLFDGPSIEGKVEKQTCNNNIHVTALPAGEINSLYSVYQNFNSGYQQYIVYCGTGDRGISNFTKVQETTGNNEVSSATETSLSKEIIELPCSADSKRFTINSSDRSGAPLSGRNLKISKGKCIATIKNTENGKIVTSLKSAAKLVQGCNQTRSLNQNNNSGFLNNHEVLYNRSNLLETPNIIPKAEATTQNVMTIIPNNNDPSFNQNAASAQECNVLLTPASFKSLMDVVDRGAVGHDTRYDSTQIESSNANSRSNYIVIDNHVLCMPESQRVTDATNVRSDVQREDCSKDLPQRKFSDRLNIIKKAMDSVKDNELRKLALKALEDCGIGVEKYIPIRPPAYKGVHDTQVQTAVFGLLDPKSFLLINKDLEDIHKINQITLHDMPLDGNLSVDKPRSDSSIAKDTENNNRNNSESDVIRQESPFDLDSFMEQFWKEDSDALKMKETLSMTRVRCNSLLEHLQKDFECVKRYENGMLGIHKAVISNNICFVQRQLMVLQHCKQSVDILTEDGTTSLELAVKYDVNSKIVELLLDAGAQPVISESVHESAVIIASKSSSPLLPLLINRVPNRKLLDQIDAEGFAAIHYCSIHGNLQGVKALLSAGATTDLKDRKSGRTSLFHSIDNGHTPVMKVLLRAGAVTSIANYAGQTPMSMISDSIPLFRSSMRNDTT